MPDHETHESHTPEPEAASEAALFASREEEPGEGAQGESLQPGSSPPAAEEIGPEEPQPVHDEPGDTSEASEIAAADEPSGAPPDAGQIAARIEALERQMSEAQDKTRYLRRVHTLREQLSQVPPGETDGLGERLDALEALSWQQLEENLQRKEALVARAEELSTSTDWKPAAEEVKSLQARWKAIGAVPQDRSQELWQRFRKAGNTFFERRQQHLRDVSQQQEENLRKKEALCARAEELSQSTQWKATSEAIKALQAEWKAVGPVPQNKADAIWKRFRGAIDVFFERQKAYFDQRNQDRDVRQGEWREQLRETLERKRDQVDRLRESIGRDEENVERWQGTLADLRPGPRAEEIRTSLDGKISDVQGKMASKRERLRELESSIQEIEAKLA